MERPLSRANRTFLAIGAALGWFALIAQFYLMIANRVTGMTETIIRYFTYFTILTNILVALTFTVLLFRPKSGWANFFSRPSTLTAVTAYITLVGITYQVILRSTWNPQGLQMIVDELLHSVIPAFVVLYWLLFLPKTGLQWKSVFPWVIYPACYLVLILFRGAFSGFYPYPFVNVKELGYNKVILNSGLILVVFLVFSLLFVAIAKIRKSTATTPVVKS